MVECTEKTLNNLNKESEKIQGMFGSIAPRYDLANSVLSMGIHHLWRKKLLSSVKKSSVVQLNNILDLCTGTGDLLSGLRALAPHARLVGGDFSKEMLKQAALRVDVQKSSAELIVADALNLPFQDNQFDLITVSFGVRNFEDLKKGLTEIRRVLNKGGQIRILEFGQPNGVVWPALYNFYSKHVMPIIGGVVTGNKEAYSYLPSSAAQFPCKERFLEVLIEVGFLQSSYSSMTGGIAYLYQARK